MNNNALIYGYYQDCHSLLEKISNILRLPYTIISKALCKEIDNNKKKFAIEDYDFEYVISTIFLFRMITLSSVNVQVYTGLYCMY